MTLLQVDGHNECLARDAMIQEKDNEREQTRASQVR